MSTYVLMRILESAPRRYDLGIHVLTLGGIGQAYDRLARRIRPGQRVLDIGCGTGALALRAARQGASVKGIDVSVAMLDIAAQRVREANLDADLELREMGTAELDSEEPESYDVVTSGLCLSELGEDELRFALRQVVRILKPAGLLLVADEVRPQSLVLRWMHAFVRTPLALLTYLISQRTSRPVPELANRLTSVGLTLESVRRNRLQSFCEIVARKPFGADP